MDDIAAARRACRLERVSGIVETAAVKPHGVDEAAPAYLNLVAEIATTLEPEVLLATLNRIELAHGGFARNAGATAPSTSTS